MKKSKMLVIAFAILAAASAAKAEGNIVDFDGRTSKAADGIQAGDIKAALSDTNSSPFTQLAVQARPVTGAQDVAVIPGRPSPEFTRKQVVDLDRSIETAIAYVNMHGQGKYLAAGFECLLQNGTPEQKYAFVYQPAGTVYSLPGNCVMRTRGGFGNACRWVLDKVCKTVTYVACAIMADGSKECHDEAREDCHTVQTCLAPEE